MPYYMSCPHCTHPRIVPVTDWKRPHLCRQCGGGYLVSGRGPRAVALQAHSVAELDAWLAAMRNRGVKKTRCA